MNLYIRLLRVLFKSLFCKKIDILDDSIIRFRAWPWDCDINLHMTGNRYTAMMDLARTYLICELHILRKLLKRRWLPVVKSQHLIYYRPIKPMQTFTVHTRVLSWDEKFFYIEQRFRSNGKTTAVGLIKGCFVNGRTTLQTQQLLDLIGTTQNAPEKPAFIQHFDRLIEGTQDLSL